MINLGKCWLVRSCRVHVDCCHKLTAAETLGCGVDVAVHEAIVQHKWVRVHCDSIQLRSFDDLDRGAWETMTDGLPKDAGLFVDLVGRPRRMQDKRMTVAEVDAIVGVQN